MCYGLMISNCHSVYQYYASELSLNISFGIFGSASDITLHIYFVERVLNIKVAGGLGRRYKVFNYYNTKKFTWDMVGAVKI